MRVLVMAHPARAAAALALADKLGGDVVYDPDPAGEPNALRCLLRVCVRAPAAEPVLVVQEDAITAPVGFLAGVDAAFAATSGDALLVLYVGRAYRACSTLDALARQRRTIGDLGHREYVPTVAVVLPAGVPARFLAWARRNAPAGYRHDDELLGAFARNEAVEVLATIPCLVDHGNTLASMAGHLHHGERSAWRFIGARDASTVPWTQ